MSYEYWLTTWRDHGSRHPVASWIDYRERRVPNWLNAAIAAAGFAAQGWITDSRAWVGAWWDC